jgi:hypothetical protein
MRGICAVFNVWSGLLGDTESSTYANYQEGRKALYQEAVLPLMDIYRDDLQSWLVPRYGDRLKLDYDRDSIEALQEDRAIKYGYLSAANWLRVNEKREAAGYEDIDEGDVVLVPISEVPLDSVREPPEVPAAEAAPAAAAAPEEEEPEEGTEGEAGKASTLVRALKEALADARAALGREKAKAAAHTGPRKGSFWSNQERKTRLWAAFETRVASRTKSFRVMAAEYQRAQAERIRQRALQVDSVHVTPAALFDLKEETERYVKKFWPWYRDNFIRAGNAGVTAAKGEIFDDAEFKADKPTTWTFRLTPKQEEHLQEMVFNSGTKVNETTIDVIYGELRRAQEENLPVAKFAQDLHDKVGEDLSRSRSMLWARTESAKVDNYGLLEGYKATEFVDLKGWLCSMVPTSREAHITADEEFTDGIPLDDAFVVDGEAMMYPGDPAGGPGNVCNCLCSTMPIVGKEGE